MSYDNLFEEFDLLIHSKANRFSSSLDLLFSWYAILQQLETQS